MFLGHRFGRIALGAVAAATAVTVPLMPAGAAPRSHAVTIRSTPRHPRVVTTTYELGNDGSSVKIGANTWILSVNYSASGTVNQLSVGLSHLVTTGGKGDELHVWNFPTSKTSSLKNPSRGKWTLVTSNKLVSVNVTFTQTKVTNAVCGGGGKESIATGTLSGTVTINTELKAAGTVKSTTWSVAGSTPSLTADAECVKTIDQCTAYSLFTSTITGSGPAAGGTIGTFQGANLDLVSVASKSSVSQVPGTVRDDVASLLSGAALSYNSPTKTFSIKTSTSGIVTGQATISKGTITTVSFTCPFGGIKYKVTSTSGQKSTYASASGKALEGHMVLTPLMTVPATSTNAMFIYNTSVKI
jgi:hypothetical protein